MIKRAVLWMFLLIFTFSASESSAECDLVTVHYHERVPYVRTIEDGVEGLTATPVSIVFKKSGVPFKWEKTPSKRQLKMIEKNRGCDCAVGWFKNPTREKFGKYTRYIYQDKPAIALARADNDKLQSGLRVDEILSNGGLTLGIKDGYSYGLFLDTNIARHKPVIDITTNENINMLKKIHSGRGDYFFVAPEEAVGLIESSGFPRKDFKFITFSDMPAGEKRYILCSKSVKDEFIERLDVAITENVLKDKL